jgi:hypothetical protein
MLSFIAFGGAAVAKQKIERKINEITKRSRVHSLTWAN